MPRVGLCENHGQNSVKKSWQTPNIIAKLTTNYHDHYDRFMSSL